MSSHMPGLETRGTDDEQAVRRPRPRAQGAAEVPGTLQPARRGEQRAQGLDLSGIHRVPCCRNEGRAAALGAICVRATALAPPEAGRRRPPPAVRVYE